MTKIDVICDYCGKGTYFVSGKEIYKSRKDLHQNNFYFCKTCHAYVRCHKGTTRPLGRLANPQLRRAKYAAHKAFDKLWINGGLSREQAYYWLSKSMNVEPSKAHIGMFDLDQCRAVVALVSERNKASNVVGNRGV